MDRGVRASPSTPKEGLVRTSGLIATRRRGSTLSLSGRRLRGRQRSPHTRGNRRTKTIYFMSKTLQGPELSYQLIEKVVLALVNATRRLRHYFLAHIIVVRTDQPIKSLLGRPDMAGRMLKWSLELFKFDICYESRKALKAQVLADFVAEMTSPASPIDGADKWTIFVDGASNATGAG
ncbi:maturase K, partial [Trifolium medium]|nr:maturase K [Trifolium medium]